MKSTSKPTLTWNPPRPFTLTPVALLAGLALGGCQLVYGSDDEPLSDPGEPHTQLPEVMPEDPPSPLAFPGCETVTSESSWCLSKDYSEGLQIVGLDSGRSCPVGIDWMSPGPSLAVMGFHAYSCGPGTSTLGRVSLVSGEQDSVAGVPCMAVTAYRGGLLVLRDLPTGELVWYESHDAVVGGRVTETFVAPGIWASRIFAVGDTLYAAWHSTDVIDTFSLQTGESTGAIALEGYDGWVHGMHVDEEGHLYILDHDGNIQVFDVESGTSLGAIRTSQPWFLEGLACFSS